MPKHETKIIKNKANQLQEFYINFFEIVIFKMSFKSRTVPNMINNAKCIAILAERPIKCQRLKINK